MGRLGRGFEGFYRAIKADIYKFCEALNFEPTWQQKLVLDMVQAAQDSPLELNPLRRIAVKSGKGPGKTTVSAISGLWRVIQDVDSLLIVTAPTMRQCKDVWLVEAKRRLSIADPLLQKLIVATKSKIVVAGRDDWGAKLVTATREENAQGYHQNRLTFIAEEASGVNRPIFNQIKTTLSNQGSLFLAIGNPNSRDSSFFDCFNSQRDEWQTLTLNAEDSPPHIVDPERNRAIEREFGRDSDVYRVSVLGEFPHSDPNCVMSSEDLEACTRTSIHECAVASRLNQPGGAPAKQFGVDFARYGSDESAVYQRSGNSIVEWKSFAKTDPSVVVDYAYKLQLESGWKNNNCWYVPDASGMGQGILHRFYDANKQIMEFHNGGASNTQSYENRITEAWFNFAKMVKAHECHIPSDNTLIKQLSTRQYYLNKHGKIVLESKDDYKDRGFESPDRADAIVMAFYDQVVASGNFAGGSGGRQIGAKIRA